MRVTALALHLGMVVHFAQCLLQQFLVEFATTPSTMSGICTMLAFW
jgi:hypothetical protein